MNRLLRYVIFMLCLQGSIYAAPSCVSKSCHLACANDPKEYHYLNCNCPCDKQYEIYANGRCSKCMHLQDPRRSARRITVTRSPAPKINIQLLRAAAVQNNPRCHSLL